MVSSVGYGMASTPSTHRASVSGEASAAVAQSAAGSAPRSEQNDAKQDAASQAAQPGVTVSISPAGATAVSRMQRADSVVHKSNASANASAAADADLDADTDLDTDVDTADIDGADGIEGGEPAGGTTASDDATPSDVSPVKAFAYGALGLERPDQPKDERNGFYSAGKWLAAGLTIGGLISLLV
ncbi:hypothetical protein PPMP20_34060 [Paraburkholderia phymatum]|uniref:Uncharacterized protein n=1 Tax=Paraburkholderia phymatum (strain DSM 17167 / CIP 108236 / LMG 21445 / STM815) TaxID=391038 RepID=B2JMP5_PARP8|nr:hypothetical protein [Paraburkholderia phymatum]ACC72839.1 hypothetical protein Bphy_3704 [Paraburkholderia phymatum STM815]